jgi:RNA polymerase sigma-70 factor, ECF subfamily
MEGFGRLVEAEIPRLRRYARALIRDAEKADDLVQSCLTRALTKQRLWQPGTDLRAWLFTILHNQYVNEIRRLAREVNTVSIHHIELLATVPPNAIPSLQLRDLEAAMGKLLPEQRQVILLVGLEGLRYDQVAAILGIPIGTVRSRVSRARHLLRKLMDREEQPPRFRRGALDASFRQGEDRGWPSLPQSVGVRLPKVTRAARASE